MQASKTIKALLNALENRFKSPVILFGFYAGLLILCMAVLLFPKKMNSNIEHRAGRLDAYVVYKAMHLTGTDPGLNIYNLDALRAANDDDTGRFITGPYYYTPPANAILKIPFLSGTSFFNYCKWFRLSDYGAQMLVVLLFLLLLRQVSPAMNSWTYMAISAFAFSMFSPMYDVQSYIIQVTGIMSALVLAGFTATVFKQNHAARAALYAASVFKIFPLLFIPFVLKPGIRSYMLFAFTCSAIAIITCVAGAYSMEQVSQFLGPKSLATKHHMQGAFSFYMNTSLVSDFMAITKGGGNLAYLFAAVYDGVSLLLFIMFAVSAGRLFFREPAFLPNRLLFAVSMVILLLEVWPVTWAFSHIIIFPYMCLLVACTQIPKVLRIAAFVYPFCFSIPFLPELTGGPALLNPFLQGYNWVTEVNTVFAGLAITVLMKAGESKRPQFAAAH
ncbi:MAG: hypothetical protein V4543_12230 [Bacteroidota bacterium]